jgi:arylsulfatase A-like enzyme
LKTEEITIPELLRPLGYTSGHFGKWHLGTLSTTIRDANRGGPQGAQHFSPPSLHGYDDSFVTESKVPTYDPMIRPPDGGRNGWDALGDDDAREPYGTRYWDHQGTEVKENLSGDDSRIIMDRVLPFIEGAVDSNKPFFAAIWFHAPHLPVVADRRHSQPYWDRGRYARNYFGCVSALDEQVGRLRQRLTELGIAENTMIWFCSDNGPEGKAGQAPGSAGELRGRKRSLYEGGVRVPSIVVWPAKVAPGQTDVAAVTSDFLPTITELIGIEYPHDRPLDGTSLAPVLYGRSMPRNQPIGFQSGKQIAWHTGNYKLYSGDQGKTWELFDLANDVGESKNLAEEKPDLVKELVRQVSAWQQSCKRSDAGDDYGS